MSALEKVLRLSGTVQQASGQGEDAAGELVLAALRDLEALRVELAWDPDNDGDDDSSAKGDTDHDYWSKSGKQKKSVPGKPMGKGGSDKGDDDGDEDDEERIYKKLRAKGMPDAAARKAARSAARKVKASALCEAAIVALAGLDRPSGSWVERTALDAWAQIRLAGDSDSNTSQGAGEQYTDPGYQKDGKKRYPVTKGGKLDATRIRAAWSYINQEDNAGEYSAEQLKSIKAKIKAAARKAGVQISDDSEKVAATMVALAASGAASMHHGTFTGMHSHAHPVMQTHDHKHYHNNDSEHHGHAHSGSDSGQESGRGGY